MALLLSDAFFPALGRPRHIRRRPFFDPFDHLLQEISTLDAGVTRKDGVFSLSFPTADFAPEELEVNVVGDSIVVEGTHSSASENGSLERRFCQKVRIPSDVDAESIQSVLDAKGNLCVSAKIKKPAVEEGKRNIPIGMAERAEAPQK
uniref:SHSP domain-containing protein n=1 Tax=Steinernema glaseri TaxID=37863 RepID=A0A1I7YA04_9BILA